MKREASGKVISFDNSAHGPVHYSNESWYEHLLCEACEKKFSCWETVCIDSLRRTARLIEKNGGGGHMMFHFDYEAIGRFLLSILWRAGISVLHPFSRVVLPPATLEEFRVALQENTSMSKVAFACRVRKLIDKTRHFPMRQMESIIISPTHRALGNVTLFSFVFGGFVVEFFTPQAPLKYRRQPGLVADHKNMFVPTVTMQEVPDLMHALAAAYKKAKSGNVTF